MAGGPALARRPRVLPLPAPRPRRAIGHGGRDGRDGRDGRAESARDRGPVSAAPFRPLTRSFSSCSGPYPAGSARLGSVRWDVWGSWDSSGRGVSKSATKAPRAGIGREEKPGISTILFRRSGAIGAFVADLDNLRRRGPLGGGGRRSAGGRSAVPGCSDDRMHRIECRFRRSRVSFPPVSATRAGAPARTTARQAPSTTSKPICSTSMPRRWSAACLPVGRSAIHASQCSRESQRVTTK